MAGLHPESRHVSISQRFHESHSESRSDDRGRCTASARTTKICSLTMVEFDKNMFDSRAKLLY